MSKGKLDALNNRNASLNSKQSYSGLQNNGSVDNLNNSF